MSDSCTIQLFADGRWHGADVADVSLFADAAKGWRAETYTGYDDAWVLDHQGRSDAYAMGSRFPVSLIAFKRPHWPAFLFRYASARLSPWRAAETARLA